MSRVRLWLFFATFMAWQGIAFSDPAHVDGEETLLEMSHAFQSEWDRDRVPDCKYWYAISIQGDGPRDSFLSLGEVFIHDNDVRIDYRVLRADENYENVFESESSLQSVAEQLDGDRLLDRGQLYFFGDSVVDHSSVHRTAVQHPSTMLTRHNRLRVLPWDGWSVVRPGVSVERLLDRNNVPNTFDRYVVRRHADRFTIKRFHRLKDVQASLQGDLKLGGAITTFDVQQPGTRYHGSFSYRLDHSGFVALFLATGELESKGRVMTRKLRIDDFRANGTSASDVQFVRTQLPPETVFTRYRNDGSIQTVGAHAAEAADGLQDLAERLRKSGTAAKPDPVNE